MKGRNLLLNLFVLLMGFTLTVSAQKSSGPDTKDMTYMEKARVNQHTGVVNPSDVLAARQQFKQVNQNRALGLDWIEVGPDNYGGHVSDVLLDNQDESGNTIYVGAFTGGIWRSTDGGLIWEKINTNEQNLFVSEFAQADDGTIYAATGIEGAYAGQGIYKSTNGVDFTRIGSTTPANDDTDTWSYISDIEIKGSKLYAATYTGLMISPDGGESWNQASTDEGAIEGICHDVTVTNNDVIFTSVEGTSYRSETNSAGFVSVSGNADTLIPSDMVKKVKFAAAPSEATKVYALATNYSGYMVGVYTSSDEGKTWQLIGPGTEGEGLFSPFFNPNDPGQGSADRGATIVVSPNDASKVYVAGTQAFQGSDPGDGGFYTWEKEFLATINVNNIRFLNPNEYYMATNSGLLSFNRNENSIASYNNYLNISSFNGVSLGVDDKILGAENGFGILRFPLEGEGVDNKHNAVTIRSGRAGVVERSFINQNTIILGFEATTGGGGENMYRSRDLGASYANIFLPEDVGSTGGDYNADFIQFALWESLNNQQSKDSVSFIAESQSYNAGDVVTVRSRSEAYPFEYTLENNLNQGDSVMVKDIVSARIFVAAEGDGNGAEVWMSKDIHQYGEVGMDWYQIAELARYEVPSAIAHSKDGNYMYVGTEGGIVYRLRNVLAAHDSATANYSSSQSAITTDTVFYDEDRMVTSIAIDPTNNNHVVITLGNYGNDHYVYETSNMLAAEPDFSSIQNNLPKAPVYSSLIEMHNSNRIIVGSELGVFSLDNNSWTAEQDGIGALPITQIRQQTNNSQTKTAINAVINGDTTYRTYKGIQNNGMIYMATYGRGLWKSANYVGTDEGPSTVMPSEGSLELYPNPVQDKVTVVVDDNKAKDFDIRIYDINGRLVMSRNLNDFNNGKVILDVHTLKNGTYLMQMNNGRNLKTGKFMILK